MNLQKSSRIFFFLLFTILTNYLLGQSRVQITVLDAIVKNKPVANAEVIIQKNGYKSAVGMTDMNGKVAINTTFSEDENTLVIINKAGYSTLTAKCLCNSLTYALSPIQNELGAIRIVLSWGKDPSDLDSHLSSQGEHIFYSNKKGWFSNLDVDDIDSFGPETVTLKKRKQGKQYIYAVHDFSNKTNPSSKEMSLSNAKVFVYTGSSLVKTYYIPRNVPGNLWVLFKITEEGEILDINKITGININSREITSEIEKQQNSIQRVAAYYNKDAVELNNKGEVLYHQKNYRDAISFYQRAIEKDGTFGQAYSNLGLAYQKIGNFAEAIWANSTAIGLANGPDKNDVKASSFYNIAKIYESKGQFEEAIQYVQFAKRYRSNPVYDSYIIKLNEKLR